MYNLTDNARPSDARTWTSGQKMCAYVPIYPKSCDNKLDQHIVDDAGVAGGQRGLVCDHFFSA